MGAASRIVEACGILLDQVQKGASHAKAEIEMGDGVDRFLFEITVKRTAGPEVSKPRKKQKRPIRSKPGA